MATVAKHFGLSDVGLAKICRRMRVPVPWRGYWQRKSAGQDVRPEKLPKLPPGLQDELKAVVIRQHTGGRGVALEGGQLAEQGRYESEAEHQIVVPEVLSNPHPLVAQAVAVLRKAKPNESGHLKPSAPCLSIRVSPDTVDRALCILDALCKALDTRGFGIEVSPPPREGALGETLVRIGADSLPIALEERVDRVLKPDPPRPRSARYAAEYSWHSPQHELVASGKLTLRIERTYLHGLRTTWADGAKQRVEKCLNAFIVGLVAAAEETRRLRLEMEERVRAAEVAEKRRQAEARRREAEAARIRALGAALDLWQHAQTVREYVAAARAALAERGELPNAELAEWLRWAEEYAAKIDPVAPVPRIPKDPEPPHPSPWDY